MSAVRYRERKQRGEYISISKFNTKLWGLEGDRLETIHNGVDTDVFNFNSFHLSNRAVWIGRITPDKGTHLAIEAARKAKINLIIAGPVTDYAYFERKVEPQLGKGVKYVGHLAQAELAFLFQSAAVTLCTPTWIEPFDFVVIESLACGTPVVAFNRGAMSELLDSQTGILVTPGRTDAMAEAIAQAKRLSRYACRKRALEQFSLETMLDKYVRAFQRIIDRHERKKICTSATISTSRVSDTPKKPKRSPNTSKTKLRSSALKLVKTTGKE